MYYYVNIVQCSIASDLNHLVYLLKRFSTTKHRRISCAEHWSGH